MKFGDNLKLVRKSKNISQEDLAERLGVSRQSVSKWETGENYPTMQNIMCLCTIFKCKINELVYEDFVDINFLDEEIKMKVIKFKKEKQKQMRVLSKAIYIIARISKVLLMIGLFCIALVMIALPIISSNIKVNDQKVTIFEKDITYEKNNKEIIIKADNYESHITKVDEYFILSKVIDYVENNSITLATFYLEMMLVFAVITIVLICILLNYIEKLFININIGDTPFTLEKVNYIKKMSYLIIALIITPSFISAFININGIHDISLNIDVISILSILILFSFAYIFEYGYEIQLDSKGKIYGEINEIEEK